MRATTSKKKHIIGYKNNRLCFTYCGLAYPVSQEEHVTFYRKPECLVCQRTLLKERQRGRNAKDN